MRSALNNVHTSGKAPRRLLTVSAVIGVALSSLAVPVAEGQVASSSGTTTATRLGSSSDGKWEGPFTLNMSPYLKEIAHAAVLPDESGKVIFWCRVDACDYSTNQRPTETWVWDSNAPASISPPIYVPNAPDTDLFCCGLTFDGDGNLIAAGGHDCVQECNGLQYGALSYGSTAVYRFPFDPNVAPENQHWQLMGYMARSRWYPTAMLVADGSIVVNGHLNNPNGGTPLTVETFDRWTKAEGWNAVASPNRIYGVATGNCGNGNLTITDYPRTFQLARSGEIMLATGVNSLTAFMKPNDATCSTFPWRWKVNTNPGSPMLAREGGSTAHLVIPDDVVANEVHDVVYAIAGAVHDDSCLPAPHLTATVDKMVDPNVTKSWDTNAPDLNLSRSDSNAVILLDGSILVVGGYGDDINGSCASRLAPEIYYPPELFPGSPGWKLLAPQQHERRYHSVAGLLPDGRVFSAGGDKPTQSHHTVEVFSPPYLFQGKRPDIVGLTTAEWSWNHPVKLTLEVAPGSTIERVALLRPGAMTHAFDMNQRYVKLRMTAQADANGKKVVTVQSPKDWYSAPPGYYFLTALDDRGRPSDARLVHIQ